MAEESNFQVHIKTLTKPLNHITDEERISLTQMLKTPKFVSQLNFVRKGKTYEFNEETYKHFQQKINNFECEQRLKCDSLFKHSFIEDFDLKTLPPEQTFVNDFNEVNLWGLCTEQELNSIVYESKQTAEICELKAKCESNPDLKWKILGFVLKEQMYIRKLKLALILKTKKNKIDKESATKKIWLALSKKKTYMIQSACNKWVESIRKAQLKNLAIQILNLSTKSRLLYFFNSFKLEKNSNLLKNYEKIIQRIKVVQKFSNLRQGLLKEDIQSKIKKMFILKLKGIRKILTYKAFFRFKATVKYEYDCIYATEIVKNITINEKHMHPLPDNLRLVLSESTKLKVERCNYSGNVIESFYTDHFEFGKILLKVEDEQKAAKEELNKQRAGKFKEKDTQVETDLLEVGFRLIMNSPRFGTSLEEQRNLFVNERVSEKSESLRIKRSKTEEPINSVEVQKDVNIEKFSAFRKLLVRQKIHEKQTNKRIFNRLIEILPRFRVSKSKLKIIQNSLLNVIKSRVSETFTHFIFVSELHQYLPKIAKNFQRLLVKVVNNKNKVVFERLKMPNKPLLVDRLNNWWKNHIKLEHIKKFYQWKGMIDSKVELSRFCSPMRHDYILTDIDSEENSRDYEYSNLLLAKTFKHDFEGMAKAYERSFNIDKLVKAINRAHENWSSRRLFNVYFNVKKSENFENLKKSEKLAKIKKFEQLDKTMKIAAFRTFEISFKFILRYSNKFENIVKVGNPEVRSAFRKIGIYALFKKMDRKQLSVYTLLHKKSLNLINEFFLYLKYQKNIGKLQVLVKVIRKHLKCMYLKSFDRWVYSGKKVTTTKKVETVEKTGTKMMDKSKKRALRSGRNPPKQLKLNLAPLILKTSLSVFTSILKFNQDLKLKRKALINLAKIVKKLIQTAVTNWKILRSYPKPKIPDYKGKFSSLSIIFYKFFRVLFTKFRVNSEFQKKTEVRIQKKKVKAQLRATKKPEKTGNLQILQKIFLKFLRIRLSQWKKNLDSFKNQKQQKARLIKKALNNLKKKFGACLRQWFTRWIKNSVKIEHLNPGQSTELNYLKSYKADKNRKSKKKVLNWIVFSLNNRCKAAMIRWINLCRLYKAKLMSDKEHHNVRRTKMMLAPIILKAFSSNAFLSFQQWKKFSCLTKTLPKAKVLIFRTGMSLKHLFKRSLKARFELLIKKKEQKVKNCLQRCGNLVKNRLSKAFVAFKFNGKLKLERIINQGVVIKGLFHRLLRKVMITPILSFGLGDSKMRLVMTLIKRTVLISYKAELERFRINSLYKKASGDLKAKEMFSVKQSFAIFNNAAKKRVEKAFLHFKNNISSTKSNKNKGKIIAGVNSLKILLLKKLKPVLYRQSLQNSLQNALKILKRVLFIQYKSSIERWKINSLNIQLSIKSKSSAFQSLHKMILAHFLQKPIQIWALATKDHKIRAKSRHLHLRSLLRGIISQVLSSYLNCLIPKETKSYLRRLIWIFDNFVLKKTMKKRFETLKLAYYAKNIQINNNLWQLKMSKERNKVQKELAERSNKGVSLSGFEKNLKQIVRNLKAIGFGSLKLYVEESYSQGKNCKSGLKKVQMVYLSSLKRALDKWNCQIKWIPERTMVTYSVSLSKLFYIYDSTCLKLRVKFFSEWKSHCALIKLQKKYACLKIKQLKVIKPNLSKQVWLSNALIQWKSLLTRNKSFQQLQNELKDAQLKSKAYQKELQNLKSSHSFLYSGLRDV